MESEGAVQVNKNEVIPSFGVGTVRMMTFVNVMKHNVTLQGVIYTTEIIHNLLSVPQAWKNRFRVRIDDDPHIAMLEQMDLHKKPSD